MTEPAKENAMSVVLVSCRTDLHPLACQCVIDALNARQSELDTLREQLETERHCCDKASREREALRGAYETCHASHAAADNAMHAAIADRDRLKAAVQSVVDEMRNDFAVSFDVDGAWDRRLETWADTLEQATGEGTQLSGEGLATKP